MMDEEQVRTGKLGNEWNLTVGASSDASIKDLMPLLEGHGVDVYLAGHWHYYESLWPASPGATGTGSTDVTKSFVDPKHIVHVSPASRLPARLFISFSTATYASRVECITQVTTGNGGPPSADNFREDCPGADCGNIPSTRFQSNEFGYGRLTVTNASHFK